MTRFAVRYAVAAVVCCGLLSIAGCTSADPDADARPRLVLVYGTCSLNKAYIEPYDASISSTSQLASFAREALVFERHQTEAGASGIAYASMLTGGQASLHRVFYHPSRIDPEIETLSAVFARAGYEAHYFGAHEMAARELGYGRGAPAERSYPGVLHGNRSELRELLARLVSDPQAKSFVLQSNSVPHSPYASPAVLLQFAERFPQLGTFEPAEVVRLLGLYREHHVALQFNFEGTVRELGLTADDVERMTAILDVAYRAQVHQLDALFGSTWQAIVDAGLADETLVVFTSDHGETLARDNALFRWSHGLQLTHDVLNVPLLIRGRRFGVEPGRFRPVTRTIDLLPTVAGLAGLTLRDPQDVEGLDLSQAIRGEVEPPRLIAFSHTAFNPTDAEAQEVVAGTIYAVADLMFPGYTPDSIWVGARRGDLWFKLRRMDGKTWQLEAFDLATDPSERVDVFDRDDPDHVVVADALRAYKARLVREFHRFELEQEEDFAVDDEERLDALRSLGYID